MKKWKNGEKMQKGKSGKKIEKRRKKIDDLGVRA